MSALRLTMAWEAAEQGPAEIRMTTGRLQLAVEGRCATRAIDDWSRTVQDDVRLSAYPLALWIAANWWRLKCEPRRSPGGTAALEPTGWAMAHCLQAAGYGYVWPNVTLESDGQTMGVTSRAVPPTAAEPIEYLSSFEARVPLDAAVGALRDFVQVVLYRLAAVGLAGADLSALWQEVLREERSNTDAAYRALEAQLGCDPGDASPDLVERLIELRRQVGAECVGEMAAACAGPDPAPVLETVLRLAAQEGLAGRLAERPGSAERHRAAITPWERGRDLARLARTHWGISAGPVNDADLASLIGLSAAEMFTGGAEPGTPAPAFAAYEPQPYAVRYHPRARSRPGRRFEVARVLADHLAAPAGDRWLPVTHLATARQKVQRAFAAEFLAPAKELHSAAGAGALDLDDLAEAYGVSPWAIEHQMRHAAAL